MGRRGQRWWKGRGGQKAWPLTLPTPVRQPQQKCHADGQRPRVCCHLTPLRLCPCLRNPPQWYLRGVEGQRSHVQALRCLYLSELSLEGGVGALERGVEGGAGALAGCELCAWSGWVRQGQGHGCRGLRGAQAVLLHSQCACEARKGGV